MDERTKSALMKLPAKNRAKLGKVAIGIRSAKSQQYLDEVDSLRSWLNGYVTALKDSEMLTEAEAALVRAHTLIGA